MMELEQVAGGYGAKPIIRGIDLSIRPGQVMVLVGPNGCGKSTLLRLAARLMAPQQGRITIAGDSIHSWSPRRVARWVALLPQSRPTPELTAATLVLHGRFPYLGYPRFYSREDRRVAEEAMEQMEVSHLAGQSVAQLSGGQRQKVYFAMAIAQTTPILLLDEPTTYLDIHHQLELAQRTRELAQQGKAVVMVLHDLNLALSYGDQVVVMERGTVQQEGSPEEIYQSGILEQVFKVNVHRLSLEDGRVHYSFTQKV